MYHFLTKYNKRKHTYLFNRSKKLMRDLNVYIIIIRYLKKSESGTSLVDLLDEKRSISGREIDEREIFELRDFRETWTVGDWPDIVFRQSSMTETGGYQLCRHLMSEN
jgi:predicted RNA-binding protein